MASDLERPPLSRGQARRLTDRINDAADNLWQLLLEAHDGQAWVALGYESWDAYVAAEFPLGRRESYRLLDQGRAVRELNAAAGLSVTRDTAKEQVRAGFGPKSLPVSVRAAAEIKPVLPHVAEEVRRRTRGKSRAERATIAADVVERARGAVRGTGPPPPNPEPTPPQAADRVARAAAVIPQLVGLDPRAVADALPAGERGRLAGRLRRWAEAVEGEARGFAQTRRDAPSSAACTHPVNRRIGTYCAACSREVGGR